MFVKRSYQFASFCKWVMMFHCCDGTEGTHAYSLPLGLGVVLGIFDPKTTEIITNSYFVILLSSRSKTQL